MTTRHLVHTAAGAALCCLFSMQAFSAEVYKWVDEKGRTHYSERKEDAGKAKAGQVKITASPAPAARPAANGKETPWPAKAPEPSDAPDNPKAPPDKRPPLRPHGVETDAHKCELARAVLSGAVRHGNGAPTDAYDRQVAESDIRAYCGK